MDSGVVLRLQIEPGGSFAGSVSAANGGPGIVFNGWVGLMAAIDELRNAPTDPGASSNVATVVQPGPSQPP